MKKRKTVTIEFPPKWEDVKVITIDSYYNCYVTAKINGIACWFHTRLLELYSRGNNDYERLESLLGKKIQLTWRMAKRNVLQMK